jgi:hypothetical protein
MMDLSDLIYWYHELVFIWVINFVIILYLVTQISLKKSDVISTKFWCDKDLNTP